jgi:conjugal transfer mating pair stabilization protein TraN
MMFTLFFGTAQAAVMQNIERNGCVVSEVTTCIDSGEKIIQGISVKKDCWATKTSYQCAEIKDTSDCDLLAAKGCTTKSAQDTCVEWQHGACAAWSRTYTCDSLSAGNGTETCSAINYCEKDENGKETCYDMSYDADKDMIPVVTLLEAGRQMGTYGDSTFFNGEALRCNLGAYGVGQSCCFISSTPKGRNGETGTANSVMMSAVWAGAKYGYQYVKAAATPYVSDAFMAAKSFLTGGATAAAGAAGAGGAAAVGFNFSYMGFGYATAGAAPAGAMSIGNAGFYFSPTGFAIAVAVYVVTQVLMCNPTDEENKLAALRSSNLCKDIGSYCAKKSALGVCKTRKRSFCCWNSTLAKQIGIQGRQQLGKNFGSAERPKCEGFTMEEFQKIDLSKMDFSEFYKEVRTNTLGIEGSGVAREDQDFWTERANSRVGTEALSQNLKDSNLNKNYSEARSEMKGQLENNGSKALSNFDLQYEEGKQPTGNLNINEEMKNDPYWQR